MLSLALIHGPPALPLTDLLTLFMVNAAQHSQQKPPSIDARGLVAKA